MPFVADKYDALLGLAAQGERHVHVLAESTGAADGTPGLNYPCAGLKQFFRHAHSEIERIAAEVRHRTPAGAASRPF